MSKAIKFSILTPNYSYHQFLFKCFESVVMQKTNSAFSFEFLVCDQSEVEEYNKIVTDAKAKFNDITFFHSDIKGVLMARHFLVQHATGDYIIFVDSDDFVSADFLLSIYESLTYYDYPDLLGVSYQKTDQKGNPLKVFGFYPSDFANHYIDYFLYTSKCNNLYSKIFKRELYSFNDYDNLILSNGDDWLFSYPIVLKAQTIATSSIFKYYYRSNNSSITHTISCDDALKGLSLKKSKISVFKPLSSFQKALLLDNQITELINYTCILKKNKRLNFQFFSKLASIIYDDYIKFFCLENVKIKTIKKRLFLRLIKHKHFYICFILLVVFKR